MIQCANDIVQGDALALGGATRLGIAGPVRMPIGPSGGRGPRTTRPA